MQRFFIKVLFFYSILLFTAKVKCVAQVPLNDLNAIKETKFTHPEYAKRNIKFMASGSNNVIVKYNPATLFFGSLMYFYQAALSPQISAECRFHLSCSNFSKQSITEFGLVKGIALTADRIMKCNRIAVSDARPGEYDERFKIYDSPSKYRLRQ